MSVKTVGYVSFPLERETGILPQLDQADIVLIRTKHNFLRHCLRKATKSYWDHVALILFPKNLEKGHFYDLIVESLNPRGVEIHKLEKYLTNPKKYDVGIKRIKNLNEKEKKETIEFMLMNIDAPYYKLSRIRFFFASLNEDLGRWLLRKQRYSCTGLVQKSFYEAASAEEKAKFTFRNDYSSPFELQESTTPADIANSENTVWLYNKK
ncbi:MAG: hypothetical protein A2469_03975 [Candidatus Magasanikbacteria bacterium RIFOXYC2_FULL_40_16]|uniref:Uncharacterized protein n=1 Tax=Candidatus Magasanikbacteria bacterium RIFOXYC2_FULL_40_16 TaxID=1798703 RepID=A0A1F6P2F6_9BACT|nr:MAG: hypothetical protein A2469_03975 [Candidatus Magasanikbacteria bacterium RIFOXYC2_FULL_40_16]